MLNVDYLFVRPDASVAGTTVLPIQGIDRVKALRRQTEWPRAFFVDGVSIYNTPAELLQRVKERKRPFAAVLAYDAQAARAIVNLQSPSGRVEGARDYVMTPNTSEFRIHASGPGIAVLGETFLPHDFRATLNGREVEYFRVNHVFKAVVVPNAGDWDVRFEYRPAHWTEAWSAASGGGILVVAMALAGIRYRVGAGSSEYPAARASS
jgi:hypothetical protein